MPHPNRLGAHYALLSLCFPQHDTLYLHIPHNLYQKTTKGCTQTIQITQWSYFGGLINLKTFWNNPWQDEIWEPLEDTELFVQLGGHLMAPLVAQIQNREAVRRQLTGHKCTPQETQNDVNKRAASSWKTVMSYISHFCFKIKLTGWNILQNYCLFNKLTPHKIIKIHTMILLGSQCWQNMTLHIQS